MKNELAPDWNEIAQGKHIGQNLQTKSSELEKRRIALNWKKIAMSTFKFRLIETKKEIRGEIRDDQCGLQKHHEEVESRSTIGKGAALARIELKRTRNDHQRKATN